MSKLNRIKRHMLDEEVQEELNGIGQNLAQTETNLFNLEAMEKLAVETDDSGRIRRAIDLCLETGVKLTASPLSIFEVNFQIDVPDDFELDLNKAIIKSESNNTIFKAGNNTDFKNILFNLNNTLDEKSTAIEIKGVEGVRVSRCIFQDGYYGILVDSSSDVKVFDCYGKKAKRWHYFFKDSSNLFVDNNTSIESEFDGIKFAGDETGETYLENITVTNNHCYRNNRDGIDFAINNGIEITIEYNVIIDNQIDGIEFKILSSADGIVDRGIFIRHNRIKMLDSGGDPSGAGVKVSGNNGVIDDIIVDDNDITLSETPITPGYEVRGISFHTVENPKARRNRIRGAYGTGITAHNCNNLDVNNNDIDVRYLGVSVSSSKGSSIVTKNKIRSGTASCVQVTGNSPDVRVYNNEFYQVNLNQYTISIDEIAVVTAYNNETGIKNVIPDRRGTVGDTVYNSNPQPGTYEKWVCVQRGNPGVWKGVNLIAS